MKEKQLPGDDFLAKIEKALKSNADPVIASGQKAYLKHQFDFFGIKSTHRREICKPYLQKSMRPSRNQLENVIKKIWKKPQREFQYFAQELFAVYQPEIDDITLIEFMIENKSWWDTVDFISSTLAGNYFKHFPEKIQPVTDQWMASGNMWLQRSCLLFQLKYKKELDTRLLSKFIKTLLGSKEFFINKAIGWILREYSKTNPCWVKIFCDQNKLNNLSRREALRLLV